MVSSSRRCRDRWSSARPDSATPAYIAVATQTRRHPAKRAEAELTEQLSRVELKGRWPDRPKAVAMREANLRARIAPPNVDDAAELVYLATGSGEILQLLPPDQGEANQIGVDASPEDPS